MEELKKKVHQLLGAKGNHLPLLQGINELVFEHQFRYIPSEIRIRYQLDKKVKLYE